MDRRERKMLPKVSERQQQARLPMSTVLGEGPAKSPMAWGSWQKAQAGAFQRSKFSWGCWGGAEAQPGSTEGCRGRGRGWVLLRQQSRDALGHGDRCQALHLCLNIIAKANKGSWSLLTGRFIEMKSSHQVVCSCFEELKPCPGSG